MNSDKACAEVGLEGATVRLEFEIAYVGWECDSKGWVVELAGKRHLILTNHGGPYIARASELLSRLKAYAGLVGETVDALQILEEVPRAMKKPVKGEKL